ncbi:glycoside hydrolase family 15 protein [Streptomyces sp. ID05-26A]|nr:glycoside hydrolase family 15 protein [Streptomyces sp. ID05-26A]
MRRSALTLRALCHQDTGAVLAAATTSLPEQIGGVRNWDYRYCWLRDAALTVQALVSLGSTGAVRELRAAHRPDRADAGGVRPDRGAVAGQPPAGLLAPGADPLRPAAGRTVTET